MSKTIGHKMFLKGEVFECDGRVAVAVPPAGMPGAIPWEILWMYPAGEGFPAWADGKVGGKLVRINPDICQPPYARLADCMAFAHHCRSQIPGHPETDDCFALMVFPPSPHPNAEEFVFWKQKIAGQEVIMVDTKKRVESYSDAPKEYKLTLTNQRVGGPPTNPPIGNY